MDAGNAGYQLTASNVLDVYGSCLHGQRNGNSLQIHDRHTASLRTRLLSNFAVMLPECTLDAILITFAAILPRLT